MTKRRWPEVKPILDRALDLPRIDRETFLIEACGDDEDLLLEIRTFLKFERDEDPLLEVPILDIIAGRPPEYRQGESIGPYRLTGEIARGGMGVVYKAERIEGGFHQDVAVKVLKRGFDTGDFVRRFRIEQQILADLDHPFISRLLDGGATEDGLPYLVMELVDGERLDHYGRERSLSVDAALQLFLKICDAVDAAHRHMVVHCDLKPSNILVTADGEPRLLDFGIAKVLSQGQDGTHSLSLRLGTPRYASPEQRNGHPISTVSDVFALGGLLYLLLTGEAPPLIEDEEQGPFLPSKAPGLTTSVARRLAGDLDAVVLRARHFRGEGRYGSVAELAADLRRHLEGVPVVARPYTFSYALMRFVGRRRREVLAVGLFLSVAAFALASGAQHAWQKSRADGLVQAFLGMLEVYDPIGSKPKAETVRAVLTKLAEDERFISPRDRRLIYDRLGRQLFRLEYFDEAESLLVQALDLVRPDDKAEEAAALNNLAPVLSRQSDDSKLQQALSYLEEAQELCRAQNPDALGLDGPSLCLDIEHNIAGVLMDQGRVDDAEAMYRRALSARRELHGDVSLEVAVTSHSLGVLLWRSSRFDDAEPLIRDAVEVRTLLLGAFNPQTLKAKTSLGALSFARDDWDSAVTAYRDAVAGRSWNLGPEHPSVARSRSGLALSLLARGLQRGSDTDLSKARHELETALQIQHLFEDPAPSVGRLIWILQRNLAAVLAAQGQGKEAEALLRRILSDTEGVPGWRQAEARNLLGSVLATQGRSDEALSLFEGTVEEVVEARGESSIYARWARERVAAARR